MLIDAFNISCASVPSGLFFGHYLKFMCKYVLMVVQIYNKKYKIKDFCSLFALQFFE